ncbi:MAG: hypothetical protein IJX16_07575 [Clostridia bacterium]|nr:hypothetical protein [Clostridia bacterium]MBQ8427598.1 hypothetical protein [Clostridia bacterium]
METNINIIFSNQQGGGSESDPETPGVTPNPEAPEETQKKPKEKDNSFNSKAIALYIGKQALSMVTSRVGVMTRSNVKQAQVNTAMKMVGYGVAIATNPVLGILAIGVDTINSALDYSEKARVEERRLSVLRERAGASNRSR